MDLDRGDSGESLCGLSTPPVQPEPHIEPMKVKMTASGRPFAEGLGWVL